MLKSLLPGFRFPAKPAPAPAPPTLTDPHTGLYNRRGLALKGDALLARLKREGLPACVVELDCSELRTVRDVCGRVPAQKLLCHVATRVVRLVGARGLAARSESTQFTLVLPGTREEVALAIASEFGDPPRISGEKAAGVRMLNLGPVVIKEVHAAPHTAANTAPAFCESTSREEPSLWATTLFLDSTSAMPIHSAATQPLRVEPG